MIALTDCDKLFYRVVVLPEMRVVWKLRPDIVRIVFRQTNKSKVEKSLGYPDHLDFVEKRFHPDNGIEFIGVELPYGEGFKYKNDMLRVLRTNQHWLSPTKETVGRLWGADALRTHKYVSEREL